MPFVPDTQPAQGTQTRPSSFVPDKPKPKGIFSRLADSYSKTIGTAGNEIRDAWKRGLAMKQDPVSTAIQTVGPVIGAGFGLIGNTAMEGAKTIAPKTTAAIGDQLQTDLKNSRIFGTDMSIPDALGKLDEIAQRHPTIAGDVKGVMNILSILPGFKGATAAVDAGKGATKAVIDSGSNLAKSSLRALDESGVGAAVKTGTSALSEIGAETSSMLKRGTDKVRAIAEEKAAQAALPEPVRNLYRAGVPEETVARITTASPQTSKLLNKMVETVSSRTKDVRSTARALDVPGEILTQTASKLSKATRAVGAELGAVKKGLKGLDVNLQGFQESLLNDVADLRLKVSKGKVVAPKGVPVDSDVLDVLNQVYPYINSANDAGIIDVLKTTLNKSFSKTGTPFSDNATRLLTKYKNEAVKAITDVSPEYGALANKYSSGMETLKDFTSLIGYKGSMENITEQSLRAGEITRRMLGNASARPTEVINGLINEAKNAGIDIGANFDDLVRFADELDDIAGLTQTTSLQGAVQRAGEAISGGASGIIGRAADNLMRLGAPGAQEKLDALRRFFSSLKK